MKIKKFTFVTFASAIDIVLNVILHIPVGEIIRTYVFNILDNFNRNEKIICLCMVNIVKKTGVLAKYNSFRRGSCKNMVLNCVFNDRGKCAITKKMYEKVGNILFEKGILILKEK